MGVRNDRPNHPELYGLSFEELIRGAIEAVLAELEFGDGPTCRLEEAMSRLEEMLWRQTVEPEPVVVPTGSFGTTAVYPLTAEE